MIGVIYARYSEGPRQTDQSIEGQVADCTAYAERSGIKVIEIYADRHHTGKDFEGRAELKRMLLDADRRRFDAVIVWKIDRLGRDRYELAVTKQRLRKAGVKLLYAEESVPDGPEGIILESVLEGLAEYYSADLRQKVMRGMKESVKKGRYCGAVPPLGYKVDEEQHLHPDPEIAPSIRQAFEMHVAGCTYAQIIEMFEKAGIKARSGRKLSTSTIYRLLRNERYTGHFERLGVALEADPIITPELFTEAQKHFKTSRNNAASTAKVDYLLSCKCFCGYCGRLLNGETGTGKSGRLYHYYKCGGRKRSSKCELKPVRQAVLEETVIRATVEQMLTPEMIGKLTKKVMEVQDQDDELQQVKLLEKQIEKNRQKQERILDAIEETGAKGLAGRLAKLEEEEEALQYDLERAKIKKPRLTEEAVRQWLMSFCDGDVSDPEFRRRLVDTFVARIDVKNGAAVITYNTSDCGPAGCSSTTREVDLTGVEPVSENKFPFLLLS